MVHNSPVKKTITSSEAASVFIDVVFRHHGMPDDIVFDRDPRFTVAFWQSLFKTLGTRLKMSTTDHPETDGQTERANRVIVDMLRAYCQEYPATWSSYIPLVEIAFNHAVHATTGFSPFFLNGLRHPLLPAILGGRASHFTTGGSPDDNIHRR